MSSKTRMATALDLGEELPGDVIGGGTVAVLGLFHLFVLGVGGWLGVALLVGLWPIAGGAAAAYVETGRRTGPLEPGLRGAVAGVFGAVATVVVVLVAGVAGLWTSFIQTTFGTELVPVTITLTVLFVVTWAAFGYVGGFAVRKAVAQE